VQNSHNYYFGNHVITTKLTGGKQNRKFYINILVAILKTL